MRKNYRNDDNNRLLAYVMNCFSVNICIHIHVTADINQASQHKTESGEADHFHQIQQLFLEETPRLVVSLMDELLVRKGPMETGTRWLSEMVQKVRNIANNRIFMDTNVSLKYTECCTTHIFIASTISQKRNKMRGT